MAEFVSSRLTYRSDDRSEVVDVWSVGDYHPKWIVLPSGKAAYLVSVTKAYDTPDDCLQLANLADMDYLALARRWADRWWNEGVPPFPDLVAAQELRQMYESQEEMAGHLVRVLEREAQMGGKWLAISKFPQGSEHF